MSSEPVAEGWVSVEVAADCVGYSESYVRLLARTGRVSAQKVNQGWLVSLEDLLAHKSRMDRLGAQRHDPRAPWREGGDQ